MNQKNTPISFRLPEDDASFIASLEIEGAKTFSDKIRKLIQKAREESLEGQADYKVLLKKFNESFSAPIEKLKLEELSFQKHSELLFLFSSWVAEVSAYFVSGLQDEEGAKLEVLETGVARRIFSLFEQVMRMGITDKAICYDEKIISQQLKPILEIAKFINSKNTEVKND